MQELPFTYRELLGTRSLAVQGAVLACLIALFAFIGPFGTYDSIGPLGRIGYWALTLGANWLVCASVMMLTLRVTSSAPMRTRLLAMAGAALAAAVPGTGVVHTAEVLFRPDYEGHNALPAIYLGVAVLMLAIGSALGAFAGLARRGVRTWGFALLGILLGAWLSRHWGGSEWTSGFLADRLWHLALPVICLSYGSLAFLSKLVRTSMLENLLCDFARTARAKGVREHDVLWRHVFRNSLLPLITVSAGILPALLGGSVIVEIVFSWPGVGRLIIDSIFREDFPMVQASIIVFAISITAANLLVDVSYRFVDPRISAGEA